MSQNQVLEFLQRNVGTKFLATEIKLYLDLGPSVYPNLRKLHKSKEIQCEMCVDKKRYKMFRYWVEK